MSYPSKRFTISGNSTAGGGGGATAVIGSLIRGLDKYDYFTIDAAITGGAGGVLNLFLQRELGDAGSDVWVDWLAFPQLSDGQATTYYCATTGSSTTITAVGRALVPLLTANTFIGGHPGNNVRLVGKAAAGAAAAAQVVVMTCWEAQR